MRDSKQWVRISKHHTSNPRKSVAFKYKEDTNERCKNYQL